MPILRGGTAATSEPSFGYRPRFDHVGRRVREEPRRGEAGGLQQTNQICERSLPAVRADHDHVYVDESRYVVLVVPRREYLHQQEPLTGLHRAAHRGYDGLATGIVP